MPAAGGNGAGHRREACKQAFQMAVQMADSKKSEDVHTLHLMAALLERSSSNLNKAIQRGGSTVEALREGIRQAIADFVPEPVPAAPGRGAGGPLLGRYGVDLTQLSRDGKIVPSAGHI